MKAKKVMMTHSKLAPFCFIIYVVLTIWSTPQVMGGVSLSSEITPSEFLAKLESKGAIKEGAYASDNYVLGVGTGRGISSQPRSSAAAARKAELVANTYILKEAVARKALKFDPIDELPEAINKKLLSISQKSVAGRIDGAHVLRTRVIDTDAEGNELLEVVVVCAIEGITVTSSMPVDVSARLQRDFKASILSSPSEQLLAFELFTDEERIQMLQMLADYLTGGKKNGTWATLMHDFSGSTAEALVHAEQFEQGGKLNELMATLNANPNHPAVCLAIAKKMVELGFSQVAALFAARGTYSYLDIIHEEECRTISEGTWAEGLLYPVDETGITKQGTEVLASEWTQEYPRIRVLLAYNGKIDPANLKTNFVLDDEFKTEMIEWGKESLLIKKVAYSALELQIAFIEEIKGLKNDPFAFMAKQKEYRQQFEKAQINSLELFVVLKLCKNFLDGKGGGEEALEGSITNMIYTTELMLQALPAMTAIFGGLDVPLNEDSIVHYAARAYEQYPSPETRELLSKTIRYSGYPEIATLIE